MLKRLGGSLVVPAVSEVPSGHLAARPGGGWLYQKHIAESVLKKNTFLYMSVLLEVQKVVQRTFFVTI